MSERTELENLIGEMAAQADDESVRADIQRQIEGKPWAQEQWLELLRENDRFGKELKGVEVPDDLESRLLTVAEPLTAPVSSSRIGIWAWALAAVVLVAIGSGLFLHLRNHSRIQTVALLAISNHLNHLDSHGIDSQSRLPRELAEELSEIVEFDVVLPDLDDRLHLVGGRKCKLGTHTVAFTLWSDPNGNYSLFQFRPGEFGISQSLPSRLVHTKTPAGNEHPCGSWIWTDRSAGYVLVGDPGCEIGDLKLGTQNGS